MFKKRPWWSYLNPTQQNLIKQSFLLLEWIKKEKKDLSDYSFIVMPAAKAYEGFLKQLFFDLKLISKRDFEEDYFRVGKALNPQLANHPYLKKKSLFRQLSQKCSQELAQNLWQTWKQCRNRLFHYFAKEQQVFTLKESEARFNQIITTMGTAFRECQINNWSNPDKTKFEEEKK